MNLRPRCCAHDPQAFTLLELLVVIVIVAVLASFLLPVFGRTKEQASVVETLSNMKQMGTAMLSYANDNNYVLPNRVLDGANDPKWPAVLQPYVQGYGVYSSPIPDVQGKSYRVSDQTLYLNNRTNYTSYIYNGMNDIGARDNAAATVRTNAIADASETILLGIPNPQTGNFYMDFSDGDNNAILNKKAFGTGSVYMLCDGSSRMLVYNNASVAGNTQRPPDSETYTDWLWLVDKTDTAVIH